MRKIKKLASLLFLLAALLIPAVASAEQNQAQVLQGGKVVATCATLQEALDMAADNEALFVRLLADLNTDATVTGQVWLDLAGHDLTGLTISGILYGMDSVTDGYNGIDAGTLKPASGAPQLHGKSDAARLGAVKRYLRVEQNGGYGFHRFYIGITAMTLDPVNAGMGYRATFAGSAQVKTALDIHNAFGMAVGLEALPETLEGVTYRGSNMAEFMSGIAFSRRMTVASILSEEAIDNDARAQMPVYGRAYIRLKDGTTIFSSQVSKDMRTMVEAVNANWSHYDDSKKAAVAELVDTHSMQISAWNIGAIHHHDTLVWQPWTGTWEDGGHYYLTDDLSFSRSLTIPQGQSLTLCLNGHDIDSTSSCSRMLQVRGNFTLCDHQNASGEYEGDMTTHYTGKTFAGVFYVFEKAVFNFCGGNLRQGEDAVMGRSGVGMIGNGNPENACATMNMYGGTISGGHVRAGWDSAANNYASSRSGYGGNIDLVAVSEFNMYGGAIYGGIVEAGMIDQTTPIPKEGSDGGNIALTGTSSVMNMYGGSVTGGRVYTAGEYGGKGGNIYVRGVLNLYGGTVSDGTTQGQGGNIYVSGQLNLYGGTVTGGTAETADIDGQPRPESGLGGGIYTTTSINHLSGDVQITGNQDSDLYLAGGAAIDGKDLDDTARIGITTETFGKISSDSGKRQCFVLNQPENWLETVADKLWLLDRQIDIDAIYATGNTFRVGYAIADITPKEEGLVLSSFGNPSGRLSKGLNYRPYVTTVAVTDAENNTFLMITADLQGIYDSMIAVLPGYISEITGVPAGNIYISATHTHNVPTVTNTSAKNTRYRSFVYNQLAVCAMEAMADRATATMQTGSFETNRMNFTRHYYYLDAQGNRVYFGDQFGLAPTGGQKIYRVVETDPTMHMLAFDREGKDPVLVVNWRAHPHRSGGKTSYTVDADVIGALREYIQQKTDYEFAFFQGAAGNTNTASRIAGETYKSGKITEYGNELGRQLVDGLVNLKPADTGLIQTKKVIYTGMIDHSEDDRKDDAQALVDFYHANPTQMDTMEEQLAKAAEYGFSSVFHASRLLEKYRLPETKDLELNIFSIGDSIGFYTAPAELWSSFSEMMETESPFPTTFCIGYSNGSVAYIPYQVDYSSYEYHYCLFEQDATILAMRDIYLAGLREQFGN